jgi:hypothetical protein
MRFVKALGLGLFVAFTGLAAIAASAAFATDTNVTKCQFNEGLCEPKNVIRPPSGGDLVLLEETTNFQLVGGIGEKCELVETTSSTKEEMSVSLLGTVEKMAFIGCSPCKKVAAAGLPYKNKVTMEEELKGDFIETTEVSFSLTECSLGMKCKFGSKETILLVKNTEGGEPEIVAEKEPLTLEEGAEAFCGKPSWSSTTKTKWTDLRDSEGHKLGEHKFWWALLP